MSSIPLLPRWFRTVGLIVIGPAVILGLKVLNHEFYFEWLSVNNFHHHPPDFGTSGENFTNELAAIVNLLALLFIAFSRLKIEDEYSSQLRLKALYIAVWVNYLMFMLAVFLVYGADFWSVTMYNVYTILIIYIITFYFLRYKMDKA